MNSDQVAQDFVQSGLESLHILSWPLSHCCVMLTGIFPPPLCPVRTLPAPIYAHVCCSRTMHLCNKLGSTSQSLSPRYWRLQLGPLKPSLPWAEEAPIPQPLLTGQVLLSGPAWWPPLNSLQLTDVFLVLGVPNWIQWSNNC